MIESSTTLGFLDALLRQARLHLTLVGAQGHWSASVCGDDGTTLAGIARGDTIADAIRAALTDVRPLAVPGSEGK